MNVQIEEGWKKALAPEFEKDYFVRLTDFVRQEYQQTTVYPPGRLIFNAFNLCPFDKVKVVIIGQDPYHGPGQAHGLCFSVNDGVAFPPSLQNIFKEIHDALFPDEPHEAQHAIESEYPVLTADWKLDVLKEQVRQSVQRIDEYRGILHIRRHLAATPLFKGIPNFRETRIRMLRAETVDELFEIMESTRPLIRQED